MAKKKERKIEQIIIHCSDSKWGNAALLDSWHRTRGWDKIGYHAVICNGHLTPELYDPLFDGCIESGRHFLEVGAHSKGHNTNSLGICLIGQGDYSLKQLGALKGFIGHWKEQIPEIEVKLHSDYNSKKPKCPGFSVDNLLGAILG